MTNQTPTQITQGLTKFFTKCAQVKDTSQQISWSNKHPYVSTYFWLNSMQSKKHNIHSIQYLTILRTEHNTPETYVAQCVAGNP